MHAASSACASARHDGKVAVVGQVMEELIAKSKAFKAAKSEQRDEDLEATEALDTKLASLLESGCLAGLVKPKGARHDRKAAEKNAPPQHGDDTEFDRFRRELVFEAKGQVRLLICRRSRLTMTSLCVH